jgi:hypothetical protein
MNVSLESRTPSNVAQADGMVHAEVVDANAGLRNMMSGDDEQLNLDQ